MGAVNVARHSEHPLHVTVVGEGHSVGRGVAYGLRRPEYLLNVAARNMSAFPDEPDHFLQWLRTRSEFESAPDVELRERFISRQIYGDYLRGIVQHSPLEAEPVVLATGNEAPLPCPAPRRWRAIRPGSAIRGGRGRTAFPGMTEPSSFSGRG